MTMSNISKQMQEAHEALPEMEAEDNYERQRIEQIEARRAAYEARLAEEDRNRTWQAQRAVFGNIGLTNGRIIDWSKM
jgi:hypothetical protein